MNMVRNEHQSVNNSRTARVGIRSMAVVLSVGLAALVMLPGTALGQTNGTPGPTNGPTNGPTSATTPTTEPTGGATTVPSPSLNLSATSGQPGASITANGGGFEADETVDVTMNGQDVGTPTVNSGGTFSLSFTVPQLEVGQFGVLATGRTSGRTAAAQFTVNQGATAPIATITPGPSTSPTPAPTPAPNAPPMIHDDRYFAQTGFRIDDDNIWSFFQQYGGIETFGFPTSRMMTFLGCPVQMFQRQIIQVCQGQGPALINLLDPEIFPYTNVNGSTFPAPDTTLKNNTPQVGTPTYATDINNFIQQTAPDRFGGQSVNFLQHFNETGGLTIWGAPISQPAPDPTNPNFVYQRFQRGIMHFIAGTGTESILLADYLKAILMGQNVPPDLMAQSQESKFFQQYCPGQPQSLCRPNDLPATDMTNAFVQG
ncbi:MAG: hypothetical protein J2P17_28420 [Mycobacterium sp.]|nr:hypothetical protein [Mycobacterium sp.]